MHISARTLFLVGTATFLAGAVAGGALQHRSVVHAQGAARVFELRTYTAPDGRLNDLQARFRNHTTRLFERHGITNIGYWTPQDDPQSQNTLVYLLAYPSREAAKQSWAAFQKDPEWQKARAESEVNGRIVSRVESLFLQPTDFSRMK
jgi:hypothetical protein